MPGEIGAEAGTIPVSFIARKPNVQGGERKLAFTAEVASGALSKEGVDPIPFFIRTTAGLGGDQVVFAFGEGENLKGYVISLSEVAKTLADLYVEELGSSE